MLDLTYIMDEEKQKQYEESIESVNKGMKLCVAKRNVERLRGLLKSEKRLGLSTKSTKLLIKSYKKDIRQFKKEGVKEIEAYCAPICHY